MAQAQEASSARPDPYADEEPDDEDHNLHLPPSEEQVLRDTALHSREALEVQHPAPDSCSG